MGAGMTKAAGPWVDIARKPVTAAQWQLASVGEQGCFIRRQRLRPHSTLAMVIQGESGVWTWCAMSSHGECNSWEEGKVMADASLIRRGVGLVLQ